MSQELAKTKDLPSEFKTCDTCKWSVKERSPDGRVGVYILACFGVPPTPVLIGMQQAPGGAVAANFQAMRPSFPTGTRACRLHETDIKILGK